LKRQNLGSNKLWIGLDGPLKNQIVLC